MEIKMNKEMEIVRFLKWTGAHQVVWESICSDDTLELNECMEISRELKRNGFYLLIFVLIQRNRNSLVMDNLLYKFISNKLADSWKGKEDAEIIAELDTAMQLSYQESL